MANTPEEEAAAAAAAAAANNGKKAVHVKWQGKTIALGTFPSGEAEEKCAKAKALTRAWRSSMRPKPTREWVINELERLGIRVVSGGRTGRKSDEDGDHGTVTGAGLNGQATSAVPANVAAMSSMMNNGAWNGGDPEAESIKRRNSSLGLSYLMNETGKTSSFSSLQSLGAGMGMGIGMDREYLGGGAAAAFNAYRDDFYQQQRAAKQRRSSSFGLGVGDSLTPGGTLQTSLSNSDFLNNNDHYQMLKLHHMNLLNEIQETTLMMNIYQQQHLQQQQQLLQQQQQGGAAGMNTSGRDSSERQMAMSMQNQGGMEAMLRNMQQQQQLSVPQSMQQATLNMTQNLQAGNINMPQNGLNRETQALQAGLQQSKLNQQAQLQNMQLNMSQNGMSRQLQESIQQNAMNAQSNMQQQQATMALSAQLLQQQRLNQSGQDLLLSRAGSDLPNVNDLYQQQENLAIKRQSDEAAAIQQDAKRAKVEAGSTMLFTHEQQKLW